MEKEYIIRKVDLHDLNELLIARKLQEQESKNNITEDYLLSFKSFIEQKLRANEIFAIGAFEDNKLVSVAYLNFLILGEKKKAPYLCGVWTSPLHRRKGLAYKVINELIKYIKSKPEEIDQNLTLTLEGTEAAAKLYEKLGFKKINGELSFLEDIEPDYDSNITFKTYEGINKNTTSFYHNGKSILQITHSQESLFPHPSNIDGKMTYIKQIKFSHTDTTIDKFKKCLQIFFSNNRFCKFNINSLEKLDIFEMSANEANFSDEKLNEFTKMIDLPIKINKNAMVMNVKEYNKKNSNTRIIEVTPENESQYLNQIGSLEEIVFNKMISDGREGQLFTTGVEDISEYIHSKENSVFVIIDENDSVMAATYITQGQKPFTYNDITKYFKTGENYQQYVASLYTSKRELLKEAIKAYVEKIKAFEYARSIILSEFNASSIDALLRQEIIDNGYHEKSVLRDKLSQYMADYIGKNCSSKDKGNYEKFYWFGIEDIESIAKESGVEFDIKIYVNANDLNIIEEYEKTLKVGQVIIHEEPTFDTSKYFTANTSNSVEIDTYITSPNSQGKGYSKIIVFEGIKKHIEKFFENENNNEIFLCSTLHRDNLPSKYVSEFFGLTDSLFVNRRQGRDREVHICRITRAEYKEYLYKLQAKLAMLYGYNPDSTEFDEEIMQQVKREQEEYDRKEVARLELMSNLSDNNSLVLENKRTKIK